MSLYSTIDRRINADAWFRGLSEGGKLLFFRLLTGPHVTPVPGLWAATEEGLARSFGLSLEGFRERFTEITRDHSGNGLPRVIADWSAGVIWLPNALKQPCNQPANENVLKGWIQHLELVPECALKDRAIAAFREWVLGCPNRFRKGWPKGLPNGSADCSDLVSPQEQDQKQDQEQEQEQQQELPEGSGGGVSGDDGGTGQNGSGGGGGGAVLQFPNIATEPRNLRDALKLPLKQRAQYACDRADMAGYLVPQRWPEVVAVHAAVVTALKLPERPLQDWGRDRGLQALVRLLAVAEPDYVTRGATALAADPWWKSRRRGLSDLSAEVLTRALGDAPEATERQTAARLKSGLRQPNAFDHTDAEQHLGAIGATEI